MIDWKASRTNQDLDARPVFPPEVVVRVKALACELPAESGVPLSRYSIAEIAAEAVSRGVVAQISGSTVWRWLDEDAIKPWHYRSWILPRDRQFEEKARRILDLYHRRWKGAILGSAEFVICADEKTNIQARRRKYAPLSTQRGHPMRVEHEYERLGSLNYLAAWDVHRAKLFGRCEAKSNIQTFDRLIDEVMTQPPYACAKRVFWIVDNGACHRGQASIDRVQSKWPKTVLVHLPTYASWLNQIEIYFSVLQRKVLKPNYFTSLEALSQRINQFQKRYERIAKPFEWKFTKTDLSKLIKKLSIQSTPLALAA